MLRSLRDLLVFNNVLSCLVSRQHNPLILKEASVTYFRTTASGHLPDLTGEFMTTRIIAVRFFRLHIHMGAGHGR